MALSNYQMSFNGFTIGAGTPYQIIDIDGLESVPELRVQDSPRGYYDGYFTGRDFFNGRTLTLTLNVFAGNSNSAQTNWNLLKAAFQPVQALTSSNGLLQFQLSPSDSTKRMTARVRSRKSKVDPEWTFGFIRAQVELFAPDYRYYSDTLVTSASLIPQAGAGRTYNRTYNLTYTSVISASAATSDNTAGNAAAAPTVTITGPVISPQITNLSTGAFMAINYSMSSTDVLVIDLSQNTITLNGSNARNLVTAGSQFFTFAAGASQVLYFTALSTTGTAVVTYRQAFA